MKLKKDDPSIAWRSRYIRHLRAHQDRNLSEAGLDDNVIFQKAKEEIPLTFTTSHLLAKIIARKRSASDR